MADTPFTLDPIPCPLCGGAEQRRMGRRGNREYHGADPMAEPHIWTYVARCRRCDLIFTNPMIRGMEHLEQAYYDDPESYQATSEGDPALMFGRRLGLIERHQRPGALLDVGAGKGEFLAEAIRRGWSGCGVEPSGTFCSYAKTAHGVDVLPGFLDQVTGLEERYFDAVTLNHVLEHVDAPVALLRLCARYAKPGGLLFVEVPNTDSHLLRLADLYFRARGLDWSSRLSPVHPPFHRYGYTRTSLQFALQKAGWHVETFVTYSGRDRGYRSATPQTLAAALRNIASTVLDRLGNRELLVAVARQGAA